MFPTALGPRHFRTEMALEMRAFLCGAITGMRGVYASLTDLATQVNRDQSGLSKLYKCVMEKEEELFVQLWNENCTRMTWVVVDQSS
jgi:hypothetical protein